MKTQNAFVQNPVQVTAVILRDVAISVQILQAANTLLGGYNRKVESIECAMVLLGQDKLREITHELFLSAAITRKESWMQKMRAKSVRAAHIMSWLSQEICLLSPHFKNGNLPAVPHDESYLVGLLHDCGKFVLLKRFADYSDLLSETANERNQSLESVEAEQYQTTHALLGSLLCNAWQLPKPLVQLIESHHHQDVFAGRPISERKYVVLHALLLLTEWIEGDMSAWEWAQHQEYVQRFFALDSNLFVPLRQKALEAIPAAALRVE
ncbi:MAG: HDOD domain-containing protein [Magnetococcales bacterium]|nr:HDOD domain-containing protein [Magnetococcales bacterium]